MLHGHNKLFLYLSISRTQVVFMNQVFRSKSHLEDRGKHLPGAKFIQGSLIYCDTKVHQCMKAAFKPV